MQCACGCKVRYAAVAGHEKSYNPPKEYVPRGAMKCLCSKLLRSSLTGSLWSDASLLCRPDAVLAWQLLLKQVLSNLHSHHFTAKRLSCILQLAHLKSHSVPYTALHCRGGESQLCSLLFRLPLTLPGLTALTLHAPGLTLVAHTLFSEEEEKAGWQLLPLDEQPSYACDCLSHFRAALLSHFLHLVTLNVCTSHFFLPAEEEKAGWELLPPEERPGYVPQAFECLRHVPLYANFIKERFERCLDLYLCPRCVL